MCYALTDFFFKGKDLFWEFQLFKCAKEAECNQFGNIRDNYDTVVSNQKAYLSVKSTAKTANIDHLKQKIRPKIIDLVRRFIGFTRFTDNFQNLGTKKNLKLIRKN